MIDSDTLTTEVQHTEALDSQSTHVKALIAIFLHLITTRKPSIMYSTLYNAANGF